MRLMDLRRLQQSTPITANIQEFSPLKMYIQYNLM